MTISPYGEMHLTYDEDVGGWQQLVYSNSDMINVVAITITVSGQSTDSYCKIFIPSIHGGTVASPQGFAQLENGQGMTFTLEAGGIGDVWINEGSGNVLDFEVRWFPSFIGRTYGHRADPYFQMSGNTKNWQVGLGS